MADELTHMYGVDGGIRDAGLRPRPRTRDPPRPRPPAAPQQGTAHMPTTRRSIRTNARMLAILRQVAGTPRRMRQLHGTTDQMRQMTGDCVTFPRQDNGCPFPL